ncbi:iron-containing alcohol dehydrogenase [Catenuloplanes atrovinosus]|uniref:3-dehydroquinate synthase n=1 Tax=Catenuloplanes atrovinosus TaxID=137266 RepID=A0AAE3YPT3_9ACTN|nr:iron-containing alcohol dehydrogenase [Catenuloplanes atrovinosus]MDR7275571.1 3-dehydroquinate synthase [Catenuloplanes atrovinosus]
MSQFGSPVRGPDGVHLRRGAEYEWCVRHRGEGMQYTIHERPGLLRRGDIAALSPRQHLIVDSGAEKYGRALAQELTDAGVHNWLYVVDGGEGCKSTDELHRLADAVQANAKRRDLVVVVGGGAVADLGRCVAAWVWKGMPLAIIPTTPTAYVDASIGVKGALNRGRKKNSVGVYFAPLYVGLDLALIQGCSADTLRAGLMEIMKMAVIDGGALWENLERSAQEMLETGFQSASSLTVTRLSITSMLRHLQPNLREHQLNRQVDLGHLLATPLEMQGLLPHGIAVGIDIALMAEYSTVLSLLPPSERDRIHAVIRSVGSPVCHELIQPDLVIDAMDAVSRQRGGVLNLPVPERIGKVRVHQRVEVAAVREAITRLHARRRADEVPRNAANPATH